MLTLSKQHKAAALGVLVALIAGSPAGAQQTTLQRLVGNAAAGSLKTADADLQRARIAAAKLDLSTRAAQFPRELSKAEIVMSRGLTASELQQFTTRRALEVVEIEMQVAVPGSSEVFTFAFSAPSLAAVEGSLSQQIDGAVNEARQRFQEMARNESHRGRSTVYASVAAARFPIYKIAAIGANEKLATTAELSRDVRFVLRRPDGNAADELAAIKALREEQRLMRSTKQSTEQSLGAPPTDGAAIAVDPANFGAASCTSRACQPPPPPPPEPTGPPPVLSGVAFVDSAINANQQFIDPYRDTGSPAPTDTSGKIMLPLSFVLACDQSVPNGNCPNDFTYTTREYTRGTFSWGANLRQLGGTALRYECGWYYRPEDRAREIPAGVEWRCGWRAVAAPIKTHGNAAAAFSFGNFTVGIPSSATGAFEYFPVSTLAWKGPITSADGSSESCIPTRYELAVVTPCAIGTVNGNRVIGTAGFEDKILIPNPNCRLPLSRLGRRFGTVQDASYGCFYPSWSFTNLPASYRDTTASDSEAIFTASMGSADGKQLVELFVYQWQMIFYADGSMGNVINQPVKHLQAVTARDPTALVCITGTGDAPADSPAACMFNVDNAFVGPDKVFR
jgi:hypothetical protein